MVGPTDQPGIVASLFASAVQASVPVMLFCDLQVALANLKALPT